MTSTEIKSFIIFAVLRRSVLRFRGVHLRDERVTARPTGRHSIIRYTVMFLTFPVPTRGF